MKQKLNLYEDDLKKKFEMFLSEKNIDNKEVKEIFNNFVDAEVQKNMVKNFKITLTEKMQSIKNHKKETIISFLRNFLVKNALKLVFFTMLTFLGIIL